MLSYAFLSEISEFLYQKVKSSCQSVLELCQRPETTKTIALKDYVWVMITIRNGNS